MLGKKQNKNRCESVQTIVPVNMDRNLCKTKINNSMERRTSTIENVYDFNNDHHCKSKEVNAVQCESESEGEQHILICGIDLIIENEGMNQSSLITSDESMVISPNTTINESWSDRKNKAKDRRRGRKLSKSDYSTPKWKSWTDSSLLTSDMSQVTEISTHDEPSGLSFGEDSNNELEIPISEQMETSTLNGPPGLLIGEKSRLGSESKSERHKSTRDWSTLNGSPDLLIGETVEQPKEFQTKAKIVDQSTLNGPPGLLIGEMVESAGELVGESQRKLLESELQGIAHKKSSIYIPLEPLVESVNSSWSESAQEKLFESEFTGKGFHPDPKGKIIKENKSSTGSTNS